MKNIVVIPIIRNDKHESKYGGFDWMEISKKTWQYWCDKHNYELVIYDKPVQDDLFRYRLTWQRWFDVINFLDEKNIEYDFLAGRKTNRGGLREISPDFFRNRIDNENSKYFAGELRADASPVFDLHTTRYSYLSPAKIKYGIKT